MGYSCNTLSLYRKKIEWHIGRLLNMMLFEHKIRNIIQSKQYWELQIKKIAVTSGRKYPQNPYEMFCKFLTGYNCAKKMIVGCFIFVKGLPGSFISSKICQILLSLVYFSNSWLFGKTSCPKRTNYGQPFPHHSNCSN